MTWVVQAGVSTIISQPKLSCLIIIFKNFSRLFVVAELFYALPLQVPLFHLLQEATVSSPPSSKHCTSVVFPYKHCCGGNVRKQNQNDAATSSQPALLASQVSLGQRCCTSEASSGHRFLFYFLSRSVLAVGSVFCVGGVCVLKGSHVYRNCGVTALPDWIQHRQP